MLCITLTNKPLQQSSFSYKKNMKNRKKKPQQLFDFSALADPKRLVRFQAERWPVPCYVDTYMHHIRDYMQPFVK